jgi:SAM-dependent methyltransferase
VREQYEQNPYPRWVRVPATQQPLAFDEHLRLHLGHGAPAVQFNRGTRVEILIAGCGTGQEAIEAAMHIRDVDVLAVDLSLSSLCYAQRKTVEGWVDNIVYAQADVTRLARIGRTFDVVSSVGVLHHTIEPAVALHQLAAVLRPGGCMRLGLYSERARVQLAAAQRFIAERGYTPSAWDIRRARQAIADEPVLEALLSYKDFYSTSECRDLLFHAREQRFTLLGIDQMLRQEGLNFLGFAIGSDAIEQYRKRFPADAMLTDLASWHQFEAEFPDTFLGMYVFWAQKPMHT